MIRQLQPWFYNTKKRFSGPCTGAELDLVFIRHGRLCGIEVKYNEATAVTRSMRSALSELNLAHLFVIYPGEAYIPWKRR
jgi:hypothetical protein